MKKLAVAVKIDDRVEQNGQVGSEVVLPSAKTWVRLVRNVVYNYNF